MYVAAVIAVAILVGFLSDHVSDQFDRLSTAYFSKAKVQQMVRLSEAVAEYAQNYRTLPASLAALASTPGYEYTAGLMNNWQGYGVSGNLADSMWTFRRAVLFTNDPVRGTTAASYLGANSCGTGGFNAATNAWCGTTNSMWYRIETRESFNDQLATEQGRLHRLDQKFANYYNKNGAYPSVDAGNVALAADSITSLAALVGYSGTAGSCTGQYQYLGIPIDCGDMFNQWGNKIAYQFVSNSHIILVSETPILNSSGVPILVANDRT